MTCCATTFCQNDSTRYVDSSDEKGGVNVLAVVDPRLVLDVLFASSIGFLLFSRVNEQRTLWLLRGWLFLVAMAWFVQRFANLPLTTKLVDALVMACSLSLAILWPSGRLLRRLMEARSGHRPSGRVAGQSPERVQRFGRHRQPDHRGSRPAVAVAAWRP